MNEMRKLMETLEQINEAAPRKKVKLQLRPKKKVGKKKAGKKMPRASKKIWMYGDEEQEKVSGPIPVSFMLAYIEASSADTYDKEIELIDTLAVNTSDMFARIFNYSFHGSPEDIAGMKKVLAGGSVAFGETEYIAGFGPNKAKAKAVYDDYLDDPEDAQDEGDWDY